MINKKEVSESLYAQKSVGSRCLYFGVTIVKLSLLVTHYVQMFYYVFQYLLSSLFVLILVLVS
jgi:hypothetical protein